MSEATLFQSKAAQWVAIGGVALLALWWLARRFGNYTAGSPYEGFGALGVLGKAADDASGGNLSAAGGAVGRTLYDWTHNDETFEDVDVLIPVIFPDGARKTISDRRVTLGRFEFGGVHYRLQKDGTGQAYAMLE